MKIKLLIGCAALVLVGILFLRPTKSKLKVCTWSNYFSDETLQRFTEKTGIPIELSLMSSNEELLSKLRAGSRGYDLIQPSDYMVRQMASMGLLERLDHSKIQNLRNLSHKDLILPYDPGLHYSIPFTRGTTGIAVRTDLISLKDRERSWKWILDSPLPSQTSLLDDMREVFAAGLLFKGHSLNSRDPNVLASIKKDLEQTKGKILTFTSEPKALLLKGEIAIAHIFSCDGLQAKKENPNIEYFIPKEGAVQWTDNFSILKGKGSKEAYAFIDYILDPEVAATIATDRSLGTPNHKAWDRLPKSMRTDAILFPTRGNLEYLMDDGKSLSLLARLWTELKN